MGRKKKQADGEEAEVGLLGGIPSKHRKYLSEEYLAKAEGMSLEELKTALVASRCCILTTEKDMEDDEDLIQAKNEVNRIKEPFVETVKEAEAKSYVLAKLLQSRGQSGEQDE